MDLRRGSLRTAVLFGGASGVALALFAGAAQAQSADGAGAAGQKSAALGEIVVTATRIKRDGYSAPTPETVISAQDIAAKAPTNIADFVTQMPAVSASASPRTATINVSSGSAGSNFLDLRGLGPTRTLVLLDGRRVVGANTQGNVDANTLPTPLISRVDVVTGGASADWGSDAVSGVVNFVLDTKFDGLKLQAQGGQTEYGDDGNWKADLAAGRSFADGRGHFVFSASYANSNGATEAGSRPWFQSQKVITNPAYAPGNGQPRLIVASNVAINNGTYGGLITSGVLRGTEFLQGGQIGQFNFGTVSGGFSLNGTPNDPAALTQLDIPLEQSNFFAHVNYTVSDAFRPFAEGTYSRAVANSLAPLNFNLGNLTIQRSNAFLPAALAARMAAAGQTSFSFGDLPIDLGHLNPHNVRELQRYVVGADGDLPGKWSYSVYAQYGRTAVDVDVHNDEIVPNFKKAIDAVVNSSGNIVCRVNAVTITDPNCVPFNPFGIGVASPQAIAYVTGVSSLHQILEQRVLSATLQGEPVSTWAGPVSVAFGLEHRREQVDSTVDALSLKDQFLAGNYKPTIGSYSVTEGFVESVVPLLRDVTFAKAVDFNGAFRRTHYSTSGDVNTWKVGANWTVTDEVRLRITRSRDIRAPNLNDLYQGGITSVGKTVIDRSTGVQTNNITEVQVGNRNLQPEIASSLTAGVVLQPNAVQNLRVSVDYYDIKIHNSIVTLADQQIVDRCAAGNAALCSFITRNSAGVITFITRSPFNISTEEERGLDIDATYRRNLSDFRDSWSGALTLRVLATHIFTRYTNDGITVDEAAGENSGSATLSSVPKWKVVSSIAYNNDSFAAMLTARTVSGGVYDVTYTAADINNNHIPGATYWDLALNYRVAKMTGSPEVFFNVDNLFNKDPVIVAPLAQQQFVAPVNASLYDVLGRTVRGGVRLQF